MARTARAQMRINHEKILDWACRYDFKVRTREEGSTIKVKVKFENENVNVFIDVPISGFPVYKGMDVPDPSGVSENMLAELNDIAWVASEMCDALPTLKRNLRDSFAK